MGGVERGRPWELEDTNKACGSTLHTSCEEEPSAFHGHVPSVLRGGDGPVTREGCRNLEDGTEGMPSSTVKKPSA